MSKNLKSLYVLAALSMGIALRSQGQTDNTLKNPHPVQEGAWTSSKNLPGTYEWQRNDNKSYHFATTYIGDDGKTVYPLQVDVTDKGKLLAAVSLDPKSDIEAVLNHQGEIVGYKFRYRSPEATKTVQKVFDKKHNAVVTMFLDKNGQQQKDSNGNNLEPKIEITKTTLDTLEKEVTTTLYILNAALSAKYSDRGQVNRKIQGLSEKKQTELVELMRYIRNVSLGSEISKDIGNRKPDLDKFITTVTGATVSPSAQVATNKADIIQPQSNIATQLGELVNGKTFALNGDAVPIYKKAGVNGQPDRYFVSYNGVETLGYIDLLRSGKIISANLPSNYNAMRIKTNTQGQLHAQLDLRAIAGQNQACDHIGTQMQRVATYTGQRKAPLSLAITQQDQIAALIGDNVLYADLTVPKGTDSATSQNIAFNWNRQEQTFNYQNGMPREDGTARAGSGRIGHNPDIRFGPQGYSLANEIANGALDAIVNAGRATLANAQMFLKQFQAIKSTPNNIK